METGSAIGRARRLRRDQTDVEAKLWHALRAKRFEGAKFRRQHPIGAFVADFACPAVKLIVELDGFQHGDDSGLARDARRTAMLEGVLHAIACAVNERR